MNKNTINGTIDELVGSTKQKTGKLIGNPTLQVKGIAQQAKGKIESVLGKNEDVIDEAKTQANRPRGPRP
jgi:uncharacterized protein YjbJ (UPF0337 family)